MSAERSRDEAPRNGSRPHILVADDQPDVLDALRFLLEPEGYTLVTVRSPAEAIRQVEATEFDAALVDLNYARDTTSGVEGLDLVSQLTAHDSALSVVVMTAWGSIDSAVEAMRRGASDYLEKPWSNLRLLATLQSQVAFGRSRRRAGRLEQENSLLRRGTATPADWIATAPSMQPVLDLMRRVGPSDATVLVTGEHGTGKERVATWLHNSSPRANRTFVTVNVGGLAEGVFESELFGHVKGAFTDARIDRPGRFELADRGSIFLDEIGNLSLSQQSKLLRVLQLGEFERVGSSRTTRVDVRVIAATNADVRAEVAAGRFREDLYFRLNTIEIRLPPLRERREDIRAIAMQSLRHHAARYGKVVSGFHHTALKQMLAHSWPGNIRELEHAVERAVLLARGSEILPQDLGLDRTGGEVAARVIEEMPLEEVEKILIQKALQRAGGNVSQAARALGLSRGALYRRMEQYGL